jgi:hypothetical protein
MPMVKKQKTERRGKKGGRKREEGRKEGGKWEKK